MLLISRMTSLSNVKSDRDLMHFEIVNEENMWQYVKTMACLAVLQKKAMISRKHKYCVFCVIFCFSVNKQANIFILLSIGQR